MILNIQFFVWISLLITIYNCDFGLLKIIYMYVYVYKYILAYIKGIINFGQRILPSITLFIYKHVMQILLLAILVYHANNISINIEFKLEIEE